MWERLEAAKETVSELAELKEENAEPDLQLSAALAMAGWRAVSPLERAVEFWDYDMEYGVQPQHIGIKWNSKVWPHSSLSSFHYWPPGG